jgi:hypothetical protein
LLIPPFIPFDEGNNKDERTTADVKINKYSNKTKQQFNPIRRKCPLKRNEDELPPEYVFVLDGVKSPNKM